MARNPRDDDVMSNDSSSDVNSDVSSGLEQLTFDDGIDHRDTDHISYPVSQSDDDYQLYTLFSGVTGACDDAINPEAIPSLSSLLKLEELSVHEFDHSLKNGDPSEVVVIRPDIIDLNSSSLLDEAVLEDTKAALSARSGSSILKDPHDPFHSLFKELQDVVCHDPPSVLPLDRGVRHEIDLVPGTK